MRIENPDNDPIIGTGSREEAIRRCESFLKRSGGQSYRKRRNYDFGPGQHRFVSRLSPYTRFHLIHPQEIIHLALEHGSIGEHEKFIDEVLWRSYWKGFLERRPSIWHCFQNWLSHPPQVSHEILGQYQSAINGTTGIEAFDFWVQELRTTNYLHNHARMWFASIWIFTLDLPWQWGADFFYEHLIDGDAASNTLSWRWVAGLHTKGKAYFARPDNIAKFTENRFKPAYLVTQVSPKIEREEQQLIELASLPTKPPRNAYSCLLVFEDDLTPDLGPLAEIKVGQIFLIQSRGHQARQSESVAQKRQDIFEQTHRRLEKHYGVTCYRFTSIDDLVKQIDKGDHQTVAYQPYMGYIKDDLQNHRLDQGMTWLRREWDQSLIIHAAQGFFPFKKHAYRYLKNQFADQILTDTLPQ